MGDSVHGVFGFGAFVFLIFTMFDSYRTAELKLRTRLEQPLEMPAAGKDQTVAAWGILLIGLGIIFLLKNFIHFDFISKLWPLVFIGLGAYLVYRYVSDREEGAGAKNADAFHERKE
jgi:hypothetical protein